MFKNFKSYISNIIIPIFVFGAVTGILTALVITLYKFCAKHIIHFSINGYQFINKNSLFLIIVIPVLVLTAYTLNLVYKKFPELKGGGIPSSIAILRGTLNFKWLINLIGTFGLSLISFLIGIPLGNEGPCVLIGTSLGNASLLLAGKKHSALKKYILTGGACSGFSAATGTSLSGVLFAIEEAHQRLSPMIILVSAVSVMFCKISIELLAPIFNIDTRLFPKFSPNTLTTRDFWIPLIISIVVGIGAVVFLRYFKVIYCFLNKKLKRINNFYKILCILIITALLGTISTSLISTGHELTIELFKNNHTILFLFVVLLLRSSLTIFSNSSGLTGGIFLPIIAIGATLCAILGKFMIMFGLSDNYYAIILALGITACISGMMKMPITAITFGIEALNCHNNIIYIIAVSAVTFAITEIFNTKSINDIVLENRTEESTASGGITTENELLDIVGEHNYEKM